MNRKIFYNGKISCMDKDSSCVEAMVTEGGIIKFVGKTSEAESFANPGSERIDLKGRRVIPGLIDTHSHFTRAALSEAKSIQFVPKSVKELLEYIKAKAKEKSRSYFL
jgi:predicted amidohydrolase YtcJ